MISDWKCAVPDSDPSSLLSGIRADIEATVAVYNLDGAGKNCFPISAAMSRHARSLLAAIEALSSALRTHQNKLTDTKGEFCAGCLEPSCPDPEAIITTALGGEAVNHSAQAAATREDEKP